MAVRKRCGGKGCRASPRCDHPWWFAVMHRGKRYRMPVDDFACPRGATATITSKQEAEKVWEPKFIAEVTSGKDPRVVPDVNPRMGSRERWPNCWTSIVNDTSTSSA